MKPAERAKEIVEGGEQTDVPFGAGDSPVTFESRWELHRKITLAIELAVKEREESWR